MLIESTSHVGFGLALLDSVIKTPTVDELLHIGMRWVHFVAGIAWIGLLYFFNLVNVPLQKKLDADTKKKVNPDLLLPALFYFRWGAVLTVLAGLAYYAMYILKTDVVNANAAGGRVNLWIVLLAWLTYPIVLFFVEFLIIKKIPVVIKDGRVFAIVMIILVAVVTFGLTRFFPAMLSVDGQMLASNRTMSIGVGGAYGIFMMLNVWGIIWPANKRILGALKGGPPAAPELARQAFMASRLNAWLSLPMLLFMGTSNHDWFIFSGK